MSSKDRYNLNRFSLVFLTGIHLLIEMLLAANTNATTTATSATDTTANTIATATAAVVISIFVVTV